MINVNYNEITKKLNVSLNGLNFNKVIEKKNYTLFFDDGGKLVQYIIFNYGFLRNSLIYNKKLKKFLGKPVFYFFA